MVYVTRTAPVHGFGESSVEHDAPKEREFFSPGMHFTGGGGIKGATPTAVNKIEVSDFLHYDLIYWWREISIHRQGRFSQ